jgi:type IV pilus assembly protein PilB
MNCQAPGCQKDLNWFRVKLLNQPGYYLESGWCCSEECLNIGIRQRLKKIIRVPEKSVQNLMRIKLGHILLESGVITLEQLEKAMAEHQAHNETRLGQFLLNMGYIKERDLTTALSRQYGLPVINVSSQKIDPSVLKIIPISILRNSRFVPVEYDDVNNTLLLVTFDPSDVSTIINLRSLLNCEVSIYLSDESVIRERSKQFCSLVESIEFTVDEISAADYGQDMDKLANLLVERAQQYDARSINFKYFGNLIWVRYLIEDYHKNLVVATAPT